MTCDLAKPAYFTRGLDPCARLGLKRLDKSLNTFAASGGSSV